MTIACVCEMQGMNENKNRNNNEHEEFPCDEEKDDDEECCNLAKGNESSTIASNGKKHERKVTK